jgi:GAF domain-containing protein
VSTGTDRTATLSTDGETLPSRALLDLHTQVLGQLSGGGSLHDTLTAIALGIERLLPAMRCVILLLDRDAEMLRCGAAPHAGREWLPWIDALVVGAQQGSRGSAIYFDREVIVDDVGDSSLYTGRFRAAALAEGIQGSWSLPIRAGTGDLLGTFALYTYDPHQPTAAERVLVEQ